MSRNNYSAHQVQRHQRADHHSNQHATVEGQQQSSHLGNIKVNTNATNTKLDLANTTLASILVDTDAADSSLNTIEAQSVLTASRLNNIQNKISANTDGTGSTLGELTVLTNTKLDTIATNTANIKISTDSVNLNVDTLETLQTATNTALTNIDAVLDTIKLDSAAIKTAVELLDNTVSGNELQVNIVSSALATGGATAANQATLIGHVDQVESKLDTLETTLTAIETDQAALEVLHTATNSKIDTIDSVLDTIKVDTEAIETAVEAIQVDAAALEVLQTATNSALGTIDSVLDTIKVDTEAIETAVEAIQVDAAALEVLQTATNTKLDTLETTLTAIETDQAALEVLHTATNSKIDTIDGVLDNIKVDTEAIETAVEAIQEAVKAEDTAHSSGDKGVMFLGVRQSSQADFGADGDYVPISINDDGEIRVTSSGGSGGATEAKQDVIETTLTAIETDAAAIEVLLTGIDADTDAIKTSVAALDNAVDGNYLNVNLNVAGTDVDGNSGNKSAASQRVVIATDDVNMSAIKTATEASATDLAALEVLQTATNSKLDTLETTLTAIETDAAALEVLVTATNSKIDTLDAVQDNALTKLGEIDAVLDNIKVDTEAVETAVEAIQTHTQMTTVQMFSGETVNSGGDTHTSSATEIIKSPANGLNFLIKSSSGSVDAGDFAVNFLVSGDNSSYSTLNTTFKQAVNDGLFQQVRIANYVPKFIKMTITNNDFSSNSDFDAFLFY